MGGQGGRNLENIVDSMSITLMEVTLTNYCSNVINPFFLLWTGHGTIPLPKFHDPSPHNFPS